MTLDKTPPAETTEDAKAFWHERHKNALDGDFFVAGYADDMQAYAEQYAAKQIERQTPAIIERFVEEVEKDLTDEWYGEGIEAALKAMQTVKARQSKGEK